MIVSWLLYILFMQSIKTSGIVLKTMNYGEADKILTIFTRDFGKVKAIAKGVRKIKSWLSGSLQQFMLLELRMITGKTFYLPTESAILREYPNIQSDLSKTAEAFYVGELIDKLFEEDEKHEEAFDLLTEILDLIDLGVKMVILRAFELKLIELAGFKPELNNCVHCKEKITAGDNFWDDIEGGVICHACQTKYRHGVDIGDSVIKLLRFFEENEIVTAKRLKVDLEVEKKTEKLLSRYIENVLDREVKSKKFLDQVGVNN